TLRQSLLAIDPGAAEVERELANGRVRLAMARSEQGEIAAAGREMAAAIATLEAMSTGSPGDDGLRFDLAHAHDRAGAMALDGGDVPASLGHHRRAIELYEGLGPGLARTPGVRSEL